MKKVMVICHGNICRSAMANIILNNYLATHKLNDKIMFNSCGISDEEQGNPLDYRAEATLINNGFASDNKFIKQHKAKQITQNDLKDFDIFITMTASQANLIRRMIDTNGYTDKDVISWNWFKSCEGDKIKSVVDVNDPWYGSMNDFEITYQIIDSLSANVVEYVLKNK